MFSISAEPLDPQALRASVRNVQAGGYVAFEGWVRNHNEGRTVERLEYEAYAAVCHAEGEAILQEARARFGVLEARCVHRVGAVSLEDMAVWVGVCSAHRGEAFEACRYIIDAVKHRLPIWKKEYYTGGDSGWVNCERCAHAGTALKESAGGFAESDYYARQVQLKEVGDTGQDKLRRARVLVVGAGGLGSPVLHYLAAAGIGTLGIAEGDVLEPSNLHRQVLFDAAGMGNPKADLAAERIAAQNPFIRIQTHPERLNRYNVADVLRGYDVIVDGTDNFETKFLLNDAAVLYKKPLVQASIYQYEGQLFVYDPDSGGPCVRCLWPELPEPGCVGSCAEVGVLGAVPGVLGSLQAMEVLKRLLGLPGQLQGDTFFLDLLTLRSHMVKGARNPECPVCGPGANRSEIAPEVSVEVSADDLARRFGEFTLIDIREEDEAASPLAGADLHWPASTVQPDRVSTDLPPPWILCCTRGMRSKYLAMALRKAGHESVFSLAGGTRALRGREVKPGGSHV